MSNSESPAAPAPIAARRKGVLARLADAWRRRHWRPDPAANAAFDALRPIVVITGASDGIGLALAHRIAGEGRDVLLIARRTGPLEAAAADIALHHGVRALWLSLDVTATDALEQIDAALAAAGSYADIVVNSAAVGLAGDFRRHSEAGVDRLVALNIAALTRLTRHYLPGMLVRGRGGVLNLASLGAYAPGPYQAAYYASKAYVVSLTVAIARECAGQGVRLCAACPGPVATSFHARMGADSAWYLRLIPVATPQRVAAQSWLRFKLGLRVALPGVVAPFLALALRLVPWRVSVPIVAALLKPRR